METGARTCVNRNITVEQIPIISILSCKDWRYLQGPADDTLLVAKQLPGSLMEEIYLKMSLLIIASTS